MSPGTCHLSTTATATDPPTANFPTMHTRLVHQDSLFNQKSPAVSVWSPTEGTNSRIDRQTDIANYRLNRHMVALVTGDMLHMICDMGQVTCDMRDMFFFFFSSSLYQSYYLQTSIDSVSPLCSFFWGELWMNFWV